MEPSRYWKSYTTGRDDDYIKLLKKLVNGKWYVATTEVHAEISAGSECKCCECYEECRHSLHRTCISQDYFGQVYAPVCKLEGLVKVGE